MTEYNLQITIVRTIGYALGILKGLNSNHGINIHPDAIKEIEDNFDYIVNQFIEKI